ncbi:MAG TPA: shikimate dehydrogenase [Candidatus Limnocylindrales bacterium]|nr:shikimate dehydrogenase [Candidatus Limnocylindrales bacterium]
MDGETQVYAILGQPVHHSRSPQIQNAAFRAAGMNAVFVALEVPASRLKQALEGLHAAHVPGLNLTAPHKEAAFSLVRERTAEAEEARAVNTLKWEPEGWRGHATDGVGFLQWVASAGVEVKGRRVLVLGAGGAARAIVPKLLTVHPESVRLVSRSADHAKALAQLAGNPSRSVPITSAGMEDQSQGGPEWDLLVRAISAEPVSPQEGLWWRGHAPGAVVLDLNYGARSAEARAQSKAMGLRYEDGGALLIHQGANSFEFWTGKKAPLDAMREALNAAG